MDIMFPVGRMVGGSLYKPYPKKDSFNQPKIGKDGKPETAFQFGVAIAKTGADWRNTEWGAKVLEEGKRAYPQQFASPGFAWKITDGDSTIPNKRGRAPSSNEGYPGHWVLWFSQSWAPKLCNRDGTQTLTEPDSIVPGFFVQVLASIKGNTPSPSPGVYLNPIAVALAAYGERIETASEVDTTTVGFGGGALPPGASAVPVSAGKSLADQFAAPPPAASAPPPPNPAILQPPVRVAPVMTAAALGMTYDQLIAAGWTNALLIQHGMMLA